MGEPGGDVRALVEQMAKALVEHPGQVEVEYAGGDDGGAVELKVAESDLGRVIGRQGRTARSLRNIVAAAGNKQHKRVTLEILE
jgi:predicted RNA-binding protein YlqC (UPF0109 family)